MIKQLIRQFLYSLSKKCFGTKVDMLLYLMNTTEDDNIFLHKNQIIDSQTEEYTKLESYYKILSSQIGNYTYVAINSRINYTQIGKFCSIGPNFFSGWGIHPKNGISTSPMFYSTRKQNGITLSDIDKVEEQKQIKIGNDVFIGMNVTVLDGVTIGDGAIIGAGSVVSKDIPAYAIAYGCPIQIAGYRFDEKTVKKLLEMKWWNWNIDQLKDVEKNFFDVETFLNKHNKE